MTKIYEGASRQMVQGKKIAVYADVESHLPIIDIHKESKKSGSITRVDDKMMVQVASPDIGGIPLDFEQVLPFFAPQYHISSDPKDYIIVPVIVVPSDLPNRNRVAFPLKQLMAANPETGQLAYESWRRKPTYREHKNDDLTQAHGMIADTSMQKLKGWAGGKVWKLMMLATFDRSKYTDYVAKIVSGEINAYSMGAWVNGYECSVCNQEVGTCDHVPQQDYRPTLTEEAGVLAFKNCIGITGFELSSVADPAWVSAISDFVKPMEN
jgi:hypothetical protein